MARVPANVASMAAAAAKAKVAGAIDWVERCGTFQDPSKCASKDQWPLGSGGHCQMLQRALLASHELRAGKPEDSWIDSELQGGVGIMLFAAKPEDPEAAKAWGKGMAEVLTKRGKWEA